MSPEQNTLAAGKKNRQSKPVAAQKFSCDSSENICKLSGTIPRENRLCCPV